jgi:hypothetical protein
MIYVCWSLIEILNAEKYRISGNANQFGEKGEKLTN